MFEKKATTTTSAPAAERSPRQKTFIGPGIHVKGDIHGQSDLELEGTVEGNVKLEGLLVVGVGGRLEGDVSANAVVVEGEILGNINARDKVQLCSNCKMKGNLRSDSLSIQEGALFEGRVTELPTRAERELEHAAVKADYENAPVYS
jgi:cytoskeletal protein CcmA (bactofilin family)